MLMVFNDIRRQPLFIAQNEIPTDDLYNKLPRLWRNALIFHYRINVAECMDKYI